MGKWNEKTQSLALYWLVKDESYDCFKKDYGQSV